MSEKYHINTATKSLGKCTAKEQSRCPFGSDPHFSDAESARIGYEKFAEQATKKDGLLRSVRKRVRAVFSGASKYVPGDRKVNDRGEVIGANWQYALTSNTGTFLNRMREELDTASRGGYFSERFGGRYGSRTFQISPPIHGGVGLPDRPAKVRFSIYEGLREDFAPQMRGVPFHSIDAAVVPSAWADPRRTTTEKQNLDVALVRDPGLAEHVQKLESIVDTFRGPGTEIEVEVTLPTDRELSQDRMQTSFRRMQTLYLDMQDPMKRPKVQAEFEREAANLAYHYSRDQYFDGLHKSRETLNRVTAGVTPQMLVQDDLAYAERYNSPVQVGQRRLSVTNYLVQHFPAIYQNNLSQVPEVI